MSNIVIDIAAEFTGKKAFKQADTATQKLSHGAKALARNLGLAFGTAAILSYSKTAIRAAAADIKGQKQLALALKNVGLERDSASAESYIQKLQSEFGIVDDKLRPAYQKMAIATRNSAEAQRLLNLSLDISAATGKDLEAVTSALSKAYLGSNTALSKLGVGISKADLKTKSFNDISNQLADTFKGAATESANTFSGQMDRLSVSTTNASEIIGVSLIGALTSLSKDNSMAGLGKDIESAAKSLANFIDSIVYLKGQIGSIPGAGIVKGAFGLVGNVLGRFSPQRAAELLKQIKGQGPASKNPIQSGTYLNNPVATKTDKVAKDTLKTNKASLALAKAKAALDLQTIQITAALKGKISEEDRLALKLQLAILTENADEATKLSERLTTLKEKNAELATKIAALPKAADPFAEWPTFIQTALAGIQDGSMTVIEKISAAVAASIALTNTAAQDSLKAGITAGNSLAEALSGSRYAAQAAAGYAGSADALAASLKAKEDTIAASNAKILADAQATQDALNKINTTKVVVPTGSTAAINAVAADAGTGNAAATIAQVATVVATIAGDSAAATATLAEVATVIATIVADSSATTTGSTVAANAAAADTVEVVTSGLAEIDAAAAALAASAAATAQATADLAAQAAANAAQAAADKADALGVASGTTVVVNVAGSVTSEVDLSGFIFDVITNMGVTGNQTVINNRSFNTAD